MTRIYKSLLLGTLILLMSFTPYRKKVVQVFLIGDSTVADYTLEAGYQSKRYPLAGWGQVLQPFLRPDSLELLGHIIKADSAVVVNKARGGRSTRTFFEEGRWAEVYRALRKNDVVLMQFGHNDGSVERPARYVNIAGYKEYLRLFVLQTRQQGAIPVLLTPVARNYPWQEGKLSNVHGDYPGAVQEVARELQVALIDLNQLSMDAFSAKGQEYVSSHYFMNLPAGTFSAYPQGQQDDTHFQVEGARAVASLVFEALKKLPVKK